MAHKPLFLYTSDFGITPIVLDRLRRGGYLPVLVKNFDCVKIIDPLPAMQTDAITRAAFDTVAAADGPYAVIAERFGRRVAKALGTQPKALDENIQHKDTAKSS